MPEKWFIRETWYDPDGKPIASTKLPGEYEHAADACQITARLNRMTEYVQHLDHTTVAYFPSVAGSGYEEELEKLPEGPTGSDWRQEQDAFALFTVAVEFGLPVVFNRYK